MTIAKLFARIGLKADQGKLNTFNKGLNAAKVGLTKMAVSAGVVSVALKKITDSAMETALAFKNFEAETGASVENLQKWTQVADEANNSGKALETSIKSLVSNQAKIELGQGNISGFQLIGIDPRQDPFKILEDLRVKLKGFTQARKKSILDQMGISSDLIQVLDLTNDEFDRMSANTFILPQSAIDQLDRARASTKTVGNAIKWLKDMIGAELAPTIEKLNKKLVEWIKNNKDGIIKTVKGIFTWLGKFVTAIGRAISFIDDVIKATVGWEKALVGIVAVLMLINAPLMLVIGLVTFLILVLEDLYVFSKGGKSLFGELLEGSPMLQKIMGFFSSLKMEMAEFFDQFKKGFGDMEEPINKTKSALDNLFKEIFGEGSTFEVVIADIGEKIGSMFRESMEWGIKTLNDITLGIRLVKGDLTLKEYQRELALNQARYQNEKSRRSAMQLSGLGAGELDTLGQMKDNWMINTPGQGGNTNNVNTTINVTSTSADPKAVVQEINNAMSDSMKKAAAQLGASQ
jgi:hypothetical protein